MEDVERIVNGNCRGKKIVIERSRAAAKRKRMMAQKAIAFSFLVCLTVILDAIGIIPNWMAHAVTIVLIGSIGYNVGRYVENERAYGNKDT